MKDNNTIINFFSPCHSFLIGVNHLIELPIRTESLLVSIPDLITFAVCCLPIFSFYTFFDSTSRFTRSVFFFFFFFFFFFSWTINKYIYLQTRTDYTFCYVGFMLCCKIFHLSLNWAFLVSYLENHVCCALVQDHNMK